MSIQPIPGAEASAIKICLHCRASNPDQKFCGKCGFPLAFDDYISARVEKQLEESIRDRDVLETESSIKVFMQAWKWQKFILGAVVTLLAVTGVSVFWRVSDFSKSTEEASKKVSDTAQKSVSEITQLSSTSKTDMTNAVGSAKTEISKASSDAIHQTQSLKAAAVLSKNEVSNSTNEFRKDLETSRQQLQAANQIRPDMERMQAQLAAAQKQIGEQQKILSSTEEFTKKILSSHTIEYFVVGQSPPGHSAVIAPPTQGTNTVVLLLLNKAPIRETIQLQWHIFAQPPNSYFQMTHNLVIFLWGDPPTSLPTKQLTVSYFPDSGDTELIKTLSEHDGRWWADDQPLPKFNQPDPDFPGNKWMPVAKAPVAINPKN